MFTSAELSTNGTFIKYNFLTFISNDFFKHLIRKNPIFNMTLVICINIYFEHWEK